MEHEDVPSSVRVSSTPIRALTLALFTIVATSGCEENSGREADPEPEDNAPVVTPGLVFEIPEDSASGVVVGTVSATAADSRVLGGWTIAAGDLRNVFGIDADTGVITVADASALDFESRSVFSLRVTASDGLHTSARETVTVNVTNVPEPPVIDAGLRFHVAEDAAPDSFVGTATARDGDDTTFRFGLTSSVGTVDAGQPNTVVMGVGSDFDDATTFSRWRVSTYETGGSVTISTEFGSRLPLFDWTITSGNRDNAFAIDSTTGVITVDTAVVYSDVTPDYTLGVTVSDGMFTSTEEVITIVVKPVPMGPGGSESERITGLGIEHVIHISVDGLHPAAIAALGPAEAPTFYRLRRDGTFTDNARTDGDLSYTLPNHTSQFTGRPVFAADGHHWWIPDDLADYEISLHDLRGEYVAGIFDVVHDYGLTTALYTSKSKFAVYGFSWNGVNGAIDNVLPDSGRNKIDRYVFVRDIEELIDRFLDDFDGEAYNYAFIHLKEPDFAGHASGWSLETGSDYLQAVSLVDSVLGRVIDSVSGDDDLADSTVVILTADHGGEFGERNHRLSRETGRTDSAIVPFYVYGVQVPAGESLYSWSPATTVDPRDAVPLNDDPSQPVRNGDVANLALQFLGLPNVPGSTIDNLHFPHF